jgi:hypothetical protein
LGAHEHVIGHGIIADLVKNNNVQGVYVSNSTHYFGKTRESLDDVIRVLKHLTNS